MAERKQPNNLSEETELDLDKITKRIKELHIQKIVSSNGSVSKNCKLAAVENLKQVFSEVITEEENKVIDNYDGKSTSVSLVKNIGYDLRLTPSRHNRNVLAKEIESQENKFLEQTKINHHSTVNLEKIQNFDEKNAGNLKDQSNPEIPAYDLRLTPARVARVKNDKNLETDDVLQKFADFDEINIATSDGGIQDTGRDQSNPEIPAYDLRLTPSRVARVKNDKNLATDDVLQKFADFDEINIATSDGGIQDTGRDQSNPEIPGYDLRLTPSRVARVKNDKNLATDGVLQKFEDFDEKNIGTSDGGIQDTGRDHSNPEIPAYDLRLTPSRASRADHAEDDKNAADDTEKIVGKGKIVDESLTKGNQSLTQSNTFKERSFETDDGDENPIPSMTTFKKSQNDSAPESCSYKTTTTNNYQKNQIKYSKQPEGNMQNFLFRCSSSNDNDTQHANRKSLDQRFGTNSKEASSGRSSPKTYRLFRDSSSALKNVPLKPMSSPYSSPNLRMVAISNQASSKLSSHETPTPKDLTKTPKKGKYFENGSPTNDRVAKNSTNSQRNDKKHTNIGSPFREQSQNLYRKQSPRGNDNKLKKTFDVKTQKENQEVQNF